MSGSFRENRNTFCNSLFLPTWCTNCLF